MSPGTYWSASSAGDGLGYDELLGRDGETVGVALDRLEKPAAGLLSSRSTVLAETRRLIATEDLLQRLGRRTR